MDAKDYLKLHRTKYLLKRDEVMNVMYEIMEDYANHVIKEHAEWQSISEDEFDFTCEDDNCKHCEAEQDIENEVLEGVDEAFFYSCECGYEGEDYECAKGYCPSCDKPIEVNLKPHLITASSGKSAGEKNKNGR